MPEIAERQFYRYDQLSAEAKAKAREEWREQTRGDPCDDLEEWLNTDLEDHFGITDSKVYYSLGHCQGDGACFEGTPDLDRWAATDPELAELLLVCRASALMLGFDEPDLHCSVKHTDRYYYHWNTMDVSVEWCNRPGNDPGNDEVSLLVSEIEHYCDEAAKDIGRKLAGIGYDEIESRDSDEYIDEYLDGTEYEWTRQGEFEN